VVVVGGQGERTLTNAAAAASPVLPRVLDTRTGLGEGEHPLLLARGGRPAATRSARVEVGDVHREIALAARPLPGHGGRGTAVAVFRDVTEERTAQRRLQETRDLFAGVLDAATEQSIIGTDADGFVTVFNVGAQRMLGYTAEEMIGRQPTMIHDPDEVRARAEELGLPYGFEVFVHAARGGATETREWTYLRQDASRLDVLLTVSAMTGPDGQVVGFIGIAHDITQRRRAERALAASEEKFRLAFETAPVGMYIFGVGAEDHGRILRVNDEMSRFVGRTPEVLRSCRVQQLADTGDERSVDALLDQLVLEPGDHQRVEIAFRRADGRVVWGSVSATVVAPEGGAPYGICLIEDVTARRQVEAELRHLALHDALTGLANRVLVLDRLGHALAQSDRDERLVGVLYLDLDGFKLVNDRWGHAEGDLLLQAVAERLHAAVRPGDTLGRLGGDEFAVVCPGLASSRDLSAMAARIAEALRQPYPLLTGRTHGEIGASIGLAVSGPGTTAEELLDSADFAMYSVKRQKRAAAGFEAAVDDVAGVPGFPGVPAAPETARFVRLAPEVAPEGVTRLVPPVG
jgi:diguanylate cyclase (GGDEF)-like protein/PAS domain S-box-containing protein